jgi:hypothetical protein
MRSLTLRLLLVSLPLLMGCEGEIANIPTTPDPVVVTETFSGTLNINGGATHNVFTSATGVVTATLTSLGENPPSKVGFTMGTLSGVGTCSVVLTNDNAVVTTVLTGTVATLGGSLCVRIHDVGALTQSVDYTLVVSHP